MTISSILGFVALAGWVALIAGIGLAVTSASQSRSPRGGITLAIAGVIIGVLFSVFSQGVIVVQPQEVAVVFDQISGDLLEPRGPGVHIIIPVVQEPTLYSIERSEYTMSGSATEGQRTGDDAVVSRTADGQEVRIEATLIFRIDPAQANLIHQNWRLRYIEELVRPTMRGIIRDEVALYSVEEVYSTQRATLNNGIEEELASRLGEEGLEVIDFLIRDVEFSQEYAQSIEQKQIAEQDRIRAEEEAERLRVQAQGERDAAVFQAEGERLAAIEIATGEAESVRIRAEAEADAILIRAEADAQALALINEQISQNPALIQWRYVDTLADNISLMLLPSNSPFLFDFESLQAETGTYTDSGDLGESEFPGTETESAPAPTTTEEDTATEGESN